MRRDGAVDARAMIRLERLLDDAVLSGMEREDGRAAAGRERVRQLLHELVEHLVLMVHIDAQRLEHAGAAFLHGEPLLLRRRALGEMDARRERVRYGLMERARRLDADAAPLLGRDLPRDFRRVRLVGVLHEHALDLLARHLREPLGGGDAGRGVEPQVERAVLLVGEAARGIVELHGGDAEIREHEVERADFRRERVDRAEIHQPEGPDVLPIAECAQAIDRLFRLDGVDVPAKKMSLPRELFEHRVRVPAVAERHVEAALSGLDREHREDLLHHDGDVHARGRIPLRDNMRDLRAVLLRLPLLVLFLEATRILAAVMDAAAVRPCRAFHLFPFPLHLRHRNASRATPRCRPRYCSA